MTNTQRVKLTVAARRRGDPKAAFARAVLTIIDERFVCDKCGRWTIWEDVHDNKCPHCQSKGGDASLLKREPEAAPLVQSEPAPMWR